MCDKQAMQGCLFFLLFPHSYYCSSYLHNYTSMDSRQVKTPKYMVYCVLVACIGSFSNGWTIGCANLPGDVTHQCPTGMRRLATPALPDCIPMGTSLWGFAVASFCVGGLIGGVAGGWIQTKLGRKKAIIWNTLGWIIGGLLLGLSVNVAMFIIGRILCGLSCGLGSLAIPTYIGETSSIRARGAMGAMNQYVVSCTFENHLCFDTCIT